MSEEGRATLHGEGVSDDAISFEPTLDLRYKGQWYELGIPLDAAMLTSPDVDAIAAAFHDEHDLLFGYHSLEMPIEVLNIRLSAVGRTSDERISLGSEITVDKPERPARREIWSPVRKAMVEVDVHQGSALGPGTELSGPAVIELGTTTIIVLDQYDCVVDRSGSFVMYLRERASEIRAQLSI
jgi:N-methylhydantoinase A